MQWLVCSVTSRRPSWWSRTKATLSSGNKNPFSCKIFVKKKTFYCIDHQHGHLVTWLQTKNSWWLSGHLFHILMVDKFMWHNFIIHITVFLTIQTDRKSVARYTRCNYHRHKLTVSIEQALICWLVFLCNRWRSCFWCFQLDLVAEVSWLTIRLVHR